MSHNQIVGASGEDAAATWYRNQGFTVLDQNWRPGPGAVNPRGELDLIVAVGQRLLVFCEVKTRTSDRYGSGASAVTQAKVLTLRRLGLQWLKTSRRQWRTVRFDVAVVNRDLDVTIYEGCI